MTSESAARRIRLRVAAVAAGCAGDEPIGWINGIVLAAGVSGLIAGLLQGEFQMPLGRRDLARLGFDGPDRGFQTEWPQDA